MANPGRIWVVGSANMDLVFRTERFPAPGETLLGGEFATFSGGKGANQAAAAGRLGGDARFVGNVGADGFGESLRASLTRCGVQIDALASDLANPTGTAAIFVDSSGQNMIVVAPGANDALDPEHVRRSLEVVGDDPVLAQLEVAQSAVIEASKQGRFILNPAPARHVPAEVLSRAYAVTPNESEARALTGIQPYDEESCIRAGSALLDLGARNAVITLGEKGCFWMSAKGPRHFAAPSVEAVDTTAAGDAFNGALALFLAEGREWENALPLANAVAALSVTKQGAQASMPNREELRAFAPELL